LLQSALDGSDGDESKPKGTEEDDKSTHGMLLKKLLLIIASFFTWMAEQWRLTKTKTEDENEDENDYSDEENDEDDSDEDLKRSTTKPISQAEVKRQDAEAKAAKTEALQKQLSEYQELQSLFVSKNAKSWNDLPGHSLIQTKEQCHLSGIQSNSAAETSSFDKKSIKFNYAPYSEVPQAQHEAYLELFEMVWTGDVQGIKLRTLAKWGPENRNEPLKVSVFESLFGNTLVMIALRHKRFDLAKMLLQIAQAQYRPKDDKVNYYVDRAGSDYGSDSDTDGSDYFVAQEISDNTFELGDVTHIPDEARSDVTALKLLRHPTKLGHLVDPKVSEKLSSPNLGSITGTALTLALVEDDLDSFIKILDLANDFDSGTSLFYISN
jgi:hypothetical protein